MGKSIVYNKGSKEDNFLDDELHLNFGIFIDGTLNNLYNTDLRTKYSRGAENGNQNKDLTNSEIEDNEKKQYKKIANKDRIEELLDIEQRDYYQQKELDLFPEKDVYLVASHRGIMAKMGTNNSYSNDYTNVARMWTCCEKKKYAIYIEGMGTTKASKDDDDGFQYGAGKSSGIRARVREACEKLADSIEIQMSQDGTKKLKEITLDVFGFSRGAASARNFVAEVNYNKGVYNAIKVDEYEYEEIENNYSKETLKIRDNIPQQPSIDNTNRSFRVNAIKKEPIKKKEMRPIYNDRDGQIVNANYILNGKIPKFGHLGVSLLEKGVIESLDDLNNVDIRIRFLGIYDTVSSYGEIGAMGGDSPALKGPVHLISSYFENDETELNLQNMGNIQQIVHFTAKDEHRENFALTKVDKKYNRVDSNGNNRLIERSFPGVHCDIGGAYLNEMETIDEIETTAFLTLKTAKTPRKELENLRQTLIDNYWFKENQIKITKPFWYYPAKIIERFSIMSLSFKTAYLAKQAAYEALSSERNVRKEYSYIPLHFMAEYCEPMITSKYMPESKRVVNTYSIAEFSILKQAKEHLKKHVLEENKEWDFISDIELKIKNINAKTDNLIRQDKLNEVQNITEQDNLNPTDYKPKIRLELEKIQGLSKNPLYKVESLTDQSLLRILRNEYFHWSSNRDWFGMDHTNDRVRIVYPRK